VLTPPSRTALSILSDDDPKPHAGATVAFIATLAQHIFLHASGLGAAANEAGVRHIRHL
jgi:hypothetical protein